MSSSTDPSIALTPLCELQPDRHRDACVDAAAEAMGALHSLFDPAVHAFCGTADGHDAMALQVQVMVALRMLSAAEKKVGKEGRRRERKWGAKMVAREEGRKGEISEMASIADSGGGPVMLLLDKSEKQFVEAFNWETGEEKAKGLVERVDKWVAVKGWILLYEDEAVAMSA